MKPLKYIKSKDLKPLRHEFFSESRGFCSLLNQKIAFENSVIDHDHSTGLIRGCIHFQANALEGKINNAYKRTGVHKFIALPDFLRNLANYLEHNKSDLNLVHPTATPKPPKLSKHSYNQLKKKCTQAMPKYTGNLTKRLTLLFEKYNIEPKFNKSK